MPLITVLWYSRACDDPGHGGTPDAATARPEGTAAGALPPPAVRPAGLPDTAGGHAERGEPPGGSADRALAGCQEAVHRRRARVEGAAVRLPDVRPVRAAGHRLLVPDGLPQGTAERAVRRCRSRRRLRGLPGQALRLGGRLRARVQPGRGRRPAPPAAARRPPPVGRELVAELLGRA